MSLISVHSTVSHSIKPFIYNFFSLFQDFLLHLKLNDDSKMHKSGVKTLSIFQDGNNQANHQLAGLPNQNGVIHHHHNGQYVNEVRSKVAPQLKPRNPKLIMSGLNGNQQMEETDSVPITTTTPKSSPEGSQVPSVGEIISKFSMKTQPSTPSPKKTTVSTSTPTKSHEQNISQQIPSVSNENRHPIPATQPNYIQNLVPISRISNQPIQTPTAEPRSSTTTVSTTATETRIPLTTTPAQPTQFLNQFLTPSPSLPNQNFSPLFQNSPVQQSESSPKPKSSPSSPGLFMAPHDQSALDRLNLSAISSARRSFNGFPTASQLSSAGGARLKKRSLPVSSSSSPATRGQTPDWIRDIFLHAKRGLIDKLVRKKERILSNFTKIYMYKVLVCNLSPQVV